MKTTNYFNTFIEVAEDCPVSEAEIPPEKALKTLANLQFDMMMAHPYKYTSDEVIFHIFAKRNNITRSALNAARQEFFSKGQACMRCSPLSKRYGWGIHFDGQGKMALYGKGTKEYEQFQKNKMLSHVKAMRSRKAAK